MEEREGLKEEIQPIYDTLDSGHLLQKAPIVKRFHGMKQIEAVYWQEDCNLVHGDDSQKRMRSQDRLINLPAELWLQCMREFIDDDPEGVFILLQLSRKWERLVIETPSLWVNIVITGSEEEYDIHILKLRVHQLLSKDLPLSLTFQFPLASTIFNNNEFLFSEYHRIRNLTFTESYSFATESTVPSTFTVEALYRAAASVLYVIPDLPLIENIDVSFTSFESTYGILDRGFPLTTPHNIRGWLIASGLLRAINVTNLRSLETGLSMGLLYEQLPGMPRLENLMIVNPSDDRSLERDKITFYLMDELFPLLVSLSYYQSGISHIQPLLTMRGYNIKKLQTMITWHEIGDLFTCLTYIPSLELLYLSLDLSQPSILVPSYQTPMLPRLRTFWISQVSSKSPPSFSNNLETLWMSLTGCMPNVLEVDFNIHDLLHISTLLNFLAHLNHLQRLVLAVMDYFLRENISERVYFASLQELDIRSGPAAQLLEAINAPMLYKVTSTEPGALPVIWPIVPRLGALYIHGSLAGSLSNVNLPELHSLTWYNAEANCANITLKFPSLCKIRFETGTDWWIIKEEINNFCEHILRFPSKCPNLEELSFCLYPVWDILLCMLLRRNMIQSSSIKTIKTIHLPGYPSPMILYPLTQLLLGKLADLPSILQLAMEEYADTFIDEDLVGCSACLVIGKICRWTASSITPSKNPMAPTVLHIAVEDVWEEPLPGASVRKWFSDWPERRLKRNVKLNGFAAHHRRYDCSLHNVHNLVTITGNTLHGIPFTSWETTFLDKI